jgi:hypothetical protein
MTTHGTEAKYITSRGEIGGDERENVERDAIERDERVPPLADSRQRGRGILIKLRNHIEGGTVPKWRLVWSLRVSGIRNVQQRTRHALQLFVQSEDELRN